MPYTVAEQAVIAKHENTPSEDVIVTTGTLVAVIDGATSKHATTYTRNGRTVTSGRFAAETIADTLIRIAPGTPPVEQVAACTRDLAAATAAQQPHLPAHQRPSASVIVYDDTLQQLWSVGDAHAAWRNTDGTLTGAATPKRIDDVTANMRAAMLAALTAAGTPWDGTGPDPGRAVILPLLELQGALANHPGEYGYPAINGIPVPDLMIRTWNLRDAVEIALASDGYPRLTVDSQLSLTAAETHLADLLAVDPACTAALRSTKARGTGQVSYDDRAWILIRRP